MAQVSHPFTKISKVQRGKRDTGCGVQDLTPQFCPLISGELGKATHLQHGNTAPSNDLEGPR